MNLWDIYHYLTEPLKLTIIDLREHLNTYLYLCELPISFALDSLSFLGKSYTGAWGLWSLPFRSTPYTQSASAGPFRVQSELLGSAPQLLYTVYISLQPPPYPLDLQMENMEQEIYPINQFKYLEQDVTSLFNYSELRGDI